MNERKLNETNDNNNEYTVKVEGVEPYRRPIWQRFFSSAAAVAVMAGGVVAAAYMLPKMSSSNHLAAQAEEQTEAEAVTETATETAAETADTAVSAPLSNEEMKKLFEDNVNVYFEAAALSSDTNTDYSAEPIQFWRYWGEYDESLGDDFGMRREGDSLYYLATYYKVK